MPSEDNKILELNQYKKSDKPQFVIYRDLKCLIERLMDVKFHRVFECLQYRHLKA